MGRSQFSRTRAADAIRFPRTRALASSTYPAKQRRSGVETVGRIGALAGRGGPPMRLKVHGGTVPHGGSSLCNTCSHATIIRGRSLDEEIVQCQASVMSPRGIPFKVTSCSSYIDSRLPSYMDLLRTAWIITPWSGRKRTAGFVRGADLDDRELAELAMETRRKERGQT
jgi:hypothetical protein